MAAIPSQQLSRTRLKSGPMPSCPSPLQWLDLPFPPVFVDCVAWWLGFGLWNQMELDLNRSPDVLPVCFDFEQFI